MSRRIAGSLSAQLFCGVLLSLLAAAAVFVPCFLLGDYILSRTVYGQPFMDRMADRQFDRLEDYVKQEKINEKNLHRLNAWCGRGDKVYLTIYKGDTVLYDFSVSNEGALDLEEYSPQWENPEREYPLTLSDGTAVRVFLYYYAGDIYYYWAVVFSGLIAFLVFSLCFVAFVHRKLRYVKRLKAELDILAGGELNYPVTVKGLDELGELASGIDQMRRSILAHQSAEDQMRLANSQLVTAMSHDLRTPLTALLAYLELMDRAGMTARSSCDILSAKAWAKPSRSRIWRTSSLNIFSSTPLSGSLRSWSLWTRTRCFNSSGGSTHSPWKTRGSRCAPASAS